VSDSHLSGGKGTYARKMSCLEATMIGATLFAVALSGCQPHGHKEGNSEYPSAIEKLAVHHEHPDPLIASQIRGRKVYEQYCQICHGAEGQGNGFNAAMLDPPPRNFADEAFWKQADVERLFTTISQGGKSVGKSVLMPPWGGTLDESQIRDVVAFLRTVPDLAKQPLAEEQQESQ